MGNGVHIATVIVADGVKDGVQVGMWVNFLIVAVGGVKLAGVFVLVETGPGIESVGFG